MRDGRQMSAPCISVIRNTRSGGWKLPFSRSELAKALSAMLDAVGAAGAELELILADDAAMEALNRAHLGCAGPTNVLSFPARSGEFFSEPAPLSEDALLSEDSLPPCLGSLVLAPETVLRECLLYGQEPKEHTLRLLAHGAAHLLGLDHGPDMDAAADAMEEAAKRHFG